MKLGMGLTAAAFAVVMAGCDKKDQDAALSQGRTVVSRAADLAGSAWKKEENQRRQAALTVKNLKSQMDRRVNDALKLKDNAEKSFKDVQDNLSQADQEYQNLKKKLNDAQSTYDVATTKVKETTERIQKL